MKHLLGEASAGEEAAVQEWISQAPTNRAYYEQFRLVWEESKALAQHSTVDEKAAWERLRSRIHAESVPRQRRLGWWRVAASIVLVAGLGLMGYWLVNNRVSVVTEQVASGSEVLHDTLSDGSVVVLNKESELIYPSRFKGDQRKVQLKGEAFFTVTPDKQKPFTIDVDSITVTVVGTSFNIRQAANRTDIIVETGLVRVQDGNTTTELKAGERLRVDSTGFHKSAVTDKLYNYYRTRSFVCDDTPLWKLVEVLNEAYDTRIIFGNESLRDLRLNAPFNNESLEQVLEVIRITFNITVTRKNGTIILE